MRQTIVYISDTDPVRQFSTPAECVAYEMECEMVAWWRSMDTSSMMGLGAYANGANYSTDPLSFYAQAIRQADAWAKRGRELLTVRGIAV